MGGEQAANTLAEVKLNQMKRNGAADRRARADRGGPRPTRKPPIRSSCRPITRPRELWDDGILDPVDTRNALGMAISASLNAPLGDAGYGVFRFLSGEGAR